MWFVLQLPEGANTHFILPLWTHMAPHYEKDSSPTVGKQVIAKKSHHG